jgi:hypothetical protein
MAATGRTVDHCHETGRVRGVLCHNCNRLVGKLEHGAASAGIDFRALAESAIRYLQTGM